jgi:hypothetical protein
MDPSVGDDHGDYLKPVQKVQLGKSKLFIASFVQPQGQRKKIQFIFWLFSYPAKTRKSVYRDLLRRLFSGDVLWNVTVSTPFSIDALISSSCKGPVFSICELLVEHLAIYYLDTSGELQGTRETVVVALSDSVSVLLAVRGGLGFNRDGESVVMYINLDLFFLQHRQFELGGYCVCLGVLVDVHPV